MTNPMKPILDESENHMPLAEVPGIERIIPQRYVWHVSETSNRSPILSHGLRHDFSHHDAIFANNQSMNIRHFFPFCLDLDFDERDLRDYDYWRIDTLKIKTNWFIDPNMLRASEEINLNKEFFVVTESSIPSEALDLFTLNFKYITPINTVDFLFLNEDGEDILDWCDEENFKSYYQMISNRFELIYLDGDSFMQVSIPETDTFPLMQVPIHKQTLGSFAKIA
jgi:hypothetical protein